MRVKNFLCPSFLFFFLCFPCLCYSQAFTSDSALRKEVKKELRLESSLSEAVIQVSVIEGVVKLTGKLDSEDQLIQAIELTQSIPGVKEVDANELSVKGSHEPLSDAIITAKIMGLLNQNHVFGDQDLDDLDITIETHHGIVTISGTADNELEINNAVALASSVSGVIEVKVHLKLSALEVNCYKQG